MVLSHQTTDLRRFADRCNTFLEFVHQFSFRPDCNNTQQKMPFSRYAHCSFSNPICFWSVWRTRAMIPGEIFTSFAEFEGIVSVDDFRLSYLTPRTFASFSGFFCWSFGLARIRQDPLGGQVLHHDCITIIVSRFTIFTENFVICCY